MRKIKTLTFTTLYPNSVQPHHGIFVEQRLRHLLASGRVETRVVAPVPWFPSGQPRFGRYAQFARVPRREERYGIPVWHPRYMLLPKVGMALAPFFLAAGAKSTVREMIANGFNFDLIDAHYFYPDGVAAAMLGHAFNKPVVITARGTDVNLIPRYFLPRRQILWASSCAAHCVTVCQALKDALVQMGVAGSHVTVLRNGVDLQLFHPVDRTAARMRLGLESITLLSVGHLIQRKGHDIIIRALARLPEVRLLVIGDGVEKENLLALARSSGVADRVKFVGAVSHDEMTGYYGAADALVLASSREGWPNVLLEAMACGTPVIASDVWGAAEIVKAPEAGVLVRERTPEAFVAAFHSLFSQYPDREATRRYAEQFSWDETTRGQIALFTPLAGAQ